MGEMIALVGALLQELLHFAAIGQLERHLGQQMDAFGFRIQLDRLPQVGRGLGMPLLLFGQRGQAVIGLGLPIRIRRLAERLEPAQRLLFPPQLDIGHGLQMARGRMASLQAVGRSQGIGGPGIIADGE
jgi:hypothetical protein